MFAEGSDRLGSPQNTAHAQGQGPQWGGPPSWPPAPRAPRPRLHPTSEPLQLLAVCGGVWAGFCSCRQGLSQEGARCPGEVHQGRSKAPGPQSGSRSGRAASVTQGCHLMVTREIAARPRLEAWQYPQGCGLPTGCFRGHAGPEPTSTPPRWEFWAEDGPAPVMTTMQGRQGAQLDDHFAEWDWPWMTVPIRSRCRGL